MDWIYGQSTLLACAGKSMKSEGQTGLEGETVPLGYITIGVELPPHFVGVSGLSGERMNDCGFGLKCTRTGLNG